MRVPPPPQIVRKRRREKHVRLVNASDGIACSDVAPTASVPAWPPQQTIRAGVPPPAPTTGGAGGASVVSPSAGGAEGALSPVSSLGAAVGPGASPDGPGASADELARRRACVDAYVAQGRLYEARQLGWTGTEATAAEGDVSRV